MSDPQFFRHRCSTADTLMWFALLGRMDDRLGIANVIFHRKPKYPLSRTADVFVQIRLGSIKDPHYVFISR